MTWVHDQIYAAGGEHLPSTWASFVNQTGVTAVLHLRPVSPASFHGPLPRGFLWMDLADESQAGLEERWLAASFIGENLEKGRRILLHSSLRRHRVRWAYVSYLIWMGRSVRASLREVEEKPWLAPYHTDERIWEDFRQFVKTPRVGENLST
ncbi:MAG: hypothetical protein A2Z14_08250 [Chloroflexi bacterium RBG_16_48_8]|nr:MAG: hypothetical protein A2Z14_08250 [Chloroflexi bacterium RBG_16_48_8]